MNFKKYHVSRNLLDYTTVENTSYATATLISGGITISGRYYVRFSSVSFTVGRSYTMSWTEKSISGTVKIMWRFQYLDGTYSVMPSSGMSLTAEKEVSALLLYVNGSSTESGVAEITNIMLNGGSTPLPYEPYSSEVWHDTPHYIHKTDTDTITTLPAVLYPTGTIATVGLKGNMSQSGTPTSTTPIQPQGTGERTGNLIPEYPTQTKMLDGVNWNVGSNGKITGNGTTTSGTNFYLLSNYSIPLKAGTYTLSFVGQKNISLILRNVTTMTTICAIWSTNSSATFTVDDDIPETDRINLYFNTSQVGISVDIDGYPMLNLGSAPLPYEPYGYKIPISSGGVTTPVYLGEVESTRQIKKLVLTGQEIGWTKASSSRVFYILSDFGALNTANVVSCMCSHYESQGNVSSVSGVSDLKCCFRTTSQTLYIHDDAFESNSDFVYYLQQQYAAGTPVCVWYVLATSTTGIVNEPIRKIGDYADEVSGISIPVTAGGDSVDIETTVKPSEVSLTYTGWHDTQCKEWNGSQWA